MESSLSQVSDPDIAVHQEKWAQEQELLKKRLVLKDDFLWKISHSLANSEESVGENRLRYIGGVDLSFPKDDSSIACGALICNVLLGLLKKMKLNAHPFYPQLLMVDGNGILHPRGFGLASHLAVLSDLPSIGVGKNLHHIDGLTHMEVKRLLPNNTKSGGDVTPLVGRSGHTWGAALRCNESCSKPIFISIGHRISLETAVSIVRMCCRFRVPEPIRQADIRSREYLQKKLRSTERS